MSSGTPEIFIFFKSVTFSNSSTKLSALSLRVLFEAFSEIKATCKILTSDGSIFLISMLKISLGKSFRKLFTSRITSWYLVSTFTPYLKSTRIIAKPSSMLVTILSTFSSSYIFFSIGFTTNSSISFGLVPG